VRKAFPWHCTGFFLAWLAVNAFLGLCSCAAAADTAEDRGSALRPLRSPFSTETFGEESSSGREGTVALSGSRLLALGPVERMEVGGIVLTPGPNDRVAVSRKDWAWRSGPKRNPASTFTFDSGRSVYAVRFNHQYSDGTLGLCEPTRCNWYESGMLNVVLDGRPFSFSSDESLTVRLDDGDRGVVCFTWDRPNARVTVRFVMLPGADALFCEIVLLPTEPLESLHLRLLNYPAGFNREPEHRVVTPERTITGTGEQQLTPESEWGLLYLDDALDCMGNSNGAGPCAVAWEIGPWCTGATVRLGSYGTRTQLTCDPATRRIRLRFVEFPGKTNGNAAAAFGKSLPEIQPMLARDDLFAPLSAGKGGAP